jgi:hypothetical protein
MYQVWKVVIQETPSRWWIVKLVQQGENMHEGMVRSIHGSCESMLQAVKDAISAKGFKVEGYRMVESWELPPRFDGQCFKIVTTTGRQATSGWDHTFLHGNSSFVDILLAGGCVGSGLKR